MRAATKTLARRLALRAATDAASPRPLAPCAGSCQSSLLPPTLALYLAATGGRLILPIVILAMGAWAIVVGRRRSDGGGVLIALGIILVLVTVLAVLGTVLGGFRARGAPKALSEERRRRGFAAPGQKRARWSASEAPQEARRAHRATFRQHAAGDARGKNRSQGSPSLHFARLTQRGQGGERKASTGVSTVSRRPLGHCRDGVQSGGSRERASGPLRLQAGYLAGRCLSGLS